MKGTKSQKKDMNILCLSFPNKANKHQQKDMNVLCLQGGDSRKTTKKKIFFGLLK